MQQHRTPSRFFSHLTTERLLLRTVLTSSLILLIELMLATHNRRGTQRGQACAGKAHHNDEVARLGHVATRGLGRSRGGHRFGAILLLVLVVGVALTAVLALFLSVVGLALALVLLLGFIPRDRGLRRRSLIRIVLVR